ncbi:MAG: hypothetical protein PHE54_03835 [Bacilli bacterium]|nr:hypothetical protein [Bacilli bacterium]
MEKKKKNYGKIKIFSLGVLSGTIVFLASATILTAKEKTDKAEFKMIDLESSSVVSQEKIEFEQSYYGVIQNKYGDGDNVRIHVFEDGENKTIDTGSTKTKLAKNYISEKELKVYTALENKDDANYFSSDYDIYLFFQLAGELYQEYLARDNFDGLEERKSILYSNFSNYVAADSIYTIGNKRFSVLDSTIQKDIILIYKNIVNMRITNTLPKTDAVGAFVKRQKEIFNYYILRRGQ